MNHASLFSGIGGFDLAAEWMGWTNLFNCEWEEFPRQVLKHHFPNAIQHGDIKELDATAYAGRVDILTGGFPCQPYSLAGKRKGKEDDRHLWPEMLRIIRECAPRYVVGENVRGLVGWDGGLVFEEVCADLEACGYSVQPFLLPACGVGAPHRRDRVWFVAWNTDSRGRRRHRAKREVSRQEQGPDTQGICHSVQQNKSVVNSDHKGGSHGHGQVQGADGEVRQRNDRAQPCDAGSGNASDTERLRLEHGTKPQSSCGSQREIREHASRHFASEGWARFPTVPPVCGRNDGLPKELDGLTFSKWRRESIKAYGNAIVPQVALQIFKAINEYENGT